MSWSEVAEGSRARTMAGALGSLPYPPPPTGVFQHFCVGGKLESDSAEYSGL